MEVKSEIRLDKSKATHIVVKDSFKGVDAGFGIKQYKYCEAKYTRFLWWKFLSYDAGYWREGKQYESCLTPMYPKEKIEENSKYSIHEDWVYTNVRVRLFVGEKIIKELFFLDLDSAKRYCDTNFHNINFII